MDYIRQTNAQRASTIRSEMNAKRKRPAHPSKAAAKPDLNLHVPWSHLFAMLVVGVLIVMPLLQALGDLWNPLAEPVGWLVFASIGCQWVLNDHYLKQQTLEDL